MNSEGIRIIIRENKKSVYKKSNENPNEFYESIPELERYEHIKIIKQDDDVRKTYSVHQVKATGSDQTIHLVFMYKDDIIPNCTELFCYPADQKNSNISDKLIKAIAAAESFYLLLELYDNINSKASTITSTRLIDNPSISTPTTVTPSTVTLTPTLIVAVIITGVVVGGGVFGFMYLPSYNALQDMENLITLANSQYENNQYELSLDTFSKVEKIFLETQFSPDHFEHAGYLHMLSLTGMGNSFQSQSNFGQIESFSEQSEEYYLRVLVLYESKYDTENAWIGRAINAIYENPEKTLEICVMFDSINSHMCQGEAYSYMYVIGEAPLEEVEEQFEIALDMAGSESQKLKVQNDIDQIYEYYKLPTE